jgi:hypothetical protein
MITKIFCRVEEVVEVEVVELLLLKLLNLQIFFFKKHNFQIYTEIYSQNIY